jgi:hypothetical protein
MSTMSTTNGAPDADPKTKPGVGGAGKDGQSVTKRLQKELMQLMVRGVFGPAISISNIKMCSDEKKTTNVPIRFAD